MPRNALTLSALSITLASGLSAIAQPESKMASIVPEETWLIAEMPTLRASWERFNNTGYGKAWALPGVRDAIIEATELDFDTLDEWLEKLEIDGEDAKVPAGAAGLAIFADLPGDLRDFNPEEDLMLLAMVEFGDTAEFYQDAIENFLERGEDEEWFVVDYDDYNDVEIVTLTTIVPEEERVARQEGVDFDGDGEFDDFYEIPATEPSEIFYAISEGTLFIGSSLEAIEMGLDGQSGDLPRTLAGSALYNETRALAGSGEDMFAYVGIDPIWKLFEEGAKVSNDPELESILASLDASGVRTTRSLGTTLAINTPEADFDNEFIVLISQMRGAWALLGTNTGAWTPGAVATADSSAAGRIMVDWDGIFPLVRQIVARFPEDQRAEAQAAVGFAEGTAGPILAGFADEIQYAQRVARPLAAGSQRGAVSIATADGTALINNLNAFGPQAGLEPRAFAGAQIFEADLFFIQLAVGVGNGQTVIGDTPTVEQALRGANDAQGGLAQTDRFRRATRWFRPNAFADSYSRTDETIRLAIWQLQNQQEIQKQQFLEMGWDEAELQNMFGNIEQPEWVAKLPPADDIAKLLGDGAAQGHVVPEGLYFRSRLMKAGN